METDLPTLPNLMFEFNDIGGWISFLIAVFLPYLVALLTKPSVPGWVRGVCLLGLSALKSLGEAFVLGGADFDLKRAAITTGMNFGVAVLFYFGIFRTTKSLAAAQTSGVK